MTETVTLPPNKSIAAGGGVSVGGAVVTVLVWAFGLHPPAEVLVALTTLALTASGIAATYFVPHGGVITDTSAGEARSTSSTS